MSNFLKIVRFGKIIISFFGPEIFEGPISLLYISNLEQQFYLQTFFFLTNIVWTHIFFRKNVIGPNNSYGPKSLTKIFAMKKLMVPKKFCTKECLVKKNVRSNKNFKSKQTLCPKNLSQNNS